MNRRGFLGVLISAVAAPMIVRPTSLMRIKPLILPGQDSSYGLPYPSLGDMWFALRNNELVPVIWNGAEWTVPPFFRDGAAWIGRDVIHGNG